MKKNTPFPTLPEALHSLKQTFDIADGSSNLKNHADKIPTDIEQFSREQTKLLNSLLQTTDENFVSLIKEALTTTLDEYIGLVSEYDISRCTRSEVLPVLLHTIGVNCVAGVLKVKKQNYGGPDPAWMLSNQSSVSVTLDWINCHYQQWQPHYKGLQQTEKDKVTSWQRGEHLPDLSSIKFVTQQRNTVIEKFDWLKNVRIHLITARAIDFTRRSREGQRLIDSALKSLVASTDNTKSNLLAELEKLNEQMIEKNNHLETTIQKTKQDIFFSTKSQNPDELKKSIDELYRQIYSSTQPNERTWITSWFNARWHVYNNDLKQAVNCYKKAFRKAYFRAGRYQEKIINESLVAAISADKPDKVFIRNLRQAQLLLRYERPSENPTEKNNFTDLVGPWETSFWKSKYNYYFPAPLHFSKAHSHNKSHGFMPVTDIETVNSIQPDFRSPNRILKDLSTYRRTPQLTLFIEFKKLDICQKLLKKRASVNKLCSKNCSPLYAALRHADLTDPNVTEPDLHFFNLVSQYKHTKEVLDTLTATRKDFPLMIAVNTGNPDVVRRVLELGASPNVFGSLDGITALQQAMNLLSISHNKGRFVQDGMKALAEKDIPMLDGLRRAGNYGFGISLQDTIKQVGKMFSCKKHMKMFATVGDIQLSKLPNSRNVRDIALLLISNNSDSNVFSLSGEGYTPLMMAAKLDEPEIAEAMLKAGGNPHLTYDYRGQKFNCWQLCNVEKSDRVKSVLRPYRTKV